MGQTQQEVSTLKRSTLVSYSAMALGPAGFLIVVNVMLPQLYAKELGLDLTRLGIALLLVRIFDTVSDQAVGLLSDRTRTRFGSRKPWVVGGVVLSFAACYALFNPPAGVTLTYFLIWRILYDMGWTLFNVTYTAWGAELSRNYADRSKITGYSQMSAHLGEILKNILPIVLFWLGVVKTSAFTLQVFSYIFWILLPVIVVAMVYSVFGTPNTVPTRHQPDLRGLVGDLRVNKPFWIFILGFLIASLGSGILALLFTFYDSYLKVGPWYPYIMMSFSVGTVVAMPVWVRIANRFGKHRAYAASMIMTAVVLQSLWLIDPARQSQGVVAALGAVVLISLSFTTACGTFAPFAILGDVVDYGTWRSGTARTGSYFAVLSLVIKLAIAVGGGIGFILLGFFHYSVKPGAHNAGSSTEGLLLTVLLTPGLLFLIGGLVIWRFPLDERRHAVVRRRIASRIAEASDPRGPRARNAVDPVQETCPEIDPGSATAAQPRPG